MIHDSDFHATGGRGADLQPAAIRIGSKVKLGSRVTVMKGARIDDGATVCCGSVVSGHVVAGAVVAGVPARPVGSGQEGSEVDLMALVMQVLGLHSVPHPDDGPDQIDGWDSLGRLRLLLALEDAYGLSIDERDMQAVHSVGAIAAMVAKYLKFPRVSGAPETALTRSRFDCRGQARMYTCR